jgi:hypothetical protein
MDWFATAERFDMVITLQKSNAPGDSHIIGTATSFCTEGSIDSNKVETINKTEGSVKLWG